MSNDTVTVNSGLDKEHFTASDSFIDRYFNRKISAIITAVLIKTPISANQVTVFNTFVGLFVAYLFQRGGYYNSLIAALIFQINTVIDHCDGEIARAKNQSSRFGFWLDLITDAIVGCAVVICIGFGLSASLNDNSYIMWGLVAGGGVLVSSTLVFYNAAKIKGHGSTISFATHENGKPPTVLELFVDNTINKNLSFYIIISVLIGKLDLLLIILAIGAQVHWVLVFIVVYRKRWSKS